MKPYTSGAARARVLLISSVAICLSLATTQAHAANNTADIPDFGRSWLKSDWIKTQTPEGEAKARAFMRVVNTPKHAYTVGNITYFKYPKVAGHTAFSYQQVLDTLKTAMEIPNWEERTVGKVHVYEGIWLSLGRYVKFYVRENSDSVEYSMAMLRLSYLRPIAAESEILQRELFGEMPEALLKSSGWLEKFTASLERFGTLLENDAQADGTSGCTCTQAGVTPACYTTCEALLASSNSGSGTGASTAASAATTAASTATQKPGSTASGISLLTSLGPSNINSVTGNITSAATSLTGSVSSLTGSVSSLTGAVSSVSGSINNASSSVTGSIANVLSVINAYQPMLQNMDSTLASYDSDWKATNQQFSRMVSLMQKQMEPGNLFLAAGATAAGAVVGSQLAGLAIDGVKFAATLIGKKIGLIKDDKSTGETIIKNFEDGMKAYKSSKDATRALEAAIDSTLGMMNALKGTGFSNEQILQGIGPGIAHLEHQLKLANQSYDNERDKSAACTLQHDQEISDLESQLKDMEMIRDKVSPGSMNPCEKLSGLLDQIDEMQGDLEHMRANLYSTKDRVLGAKVDLDKFDAIENQAMFKDAHSDKTAAEEHKQDDGISQRHSQETTQRQRDLIHTCDSLVTSTLYGYKASKVFTGGIDKACNGFVLDSKSSTADFLSHFTDPAVRDAAYTKMHDNTNFLADVTQLDNKVAAREAAHSDVSAKIDLLAKERKAMAPTLTGSDQASEGQYMKFAKDFNELLLDQSGSDTARIFTDLARGRKKIVDSCGGDTIGQTLAERKAEYNDGRGGEH
jgi:hypothetical protein